MKSADFLKTTQDRIWNSGAFLPNDSDGAEITYCNLATDAVFKAFNYSAFSGMLADQMMAYVKTSKDFLIKPMAGIQELVNEGTLIVAGLTAEQLGQSHGHICTLTPGAEDYSGHWNLKTPQCLSIGRKAICFRSKGVNWAFVPQPEFYAWVPTL